MTIEERVNQLESDIEKIMLDNQQYVVSNTALQAGIYSKVAVDCKGLVTGGYTLSSNDLPTIPLDKVNGLRETIDDLVTKSDMEQYDLSSYTTLVRRTDVMTPSVGLKVAFNEYGLITSVVEAVASDIPVLPISKIYGLETKLGILEEGLNTALTSTDRPTISAGTGCKISFDKYGYVLGGVDLIQDDLPDETLNRVSALEAALSNTVDSQSLTAIQTSVSNKVDKNDSIQSGTYMKVDVDNKGLVTKGYFITADDLPDIEIKNIVRLQETLELKADVASYNTLLSKIESIMSNGVFQDQYLGLTNALEAKADRSEMEVYTTLIEHFRDVVNKLTYSTDVETLNAAVDSLNTAINAICGRLDTIESRIANNVSLGNLK